jgi:parallel beta-helix repeat protein
LFWGSQVQKIIPIIGIILILLLSSLSFTTIGTEEVTSTVIYVDDEGDGDFTSIQDAVDNSSDGCTILVFSGEYEPFRIMNDNPSDDLNGLQIKGLSYEFKEGNDTGKPIIKGRSKINRLIYLSRVVNCIIQGFNITFGGEGFLIYDSWNNTIANNTITSCTVGIQLDEFVYPELTTGNIIINNTIKDCYIGIQLEYSIKNIICGNIILNCSEWGVNILGDSNKINHNLILENGHFSIWGEPHGGGINIVNKDCIIEYNHFSDNVYGVFLYSNKNFICYNNFIHSTESHSIFMYSFFNHWRYNFWDDWKGYGPKIINGYLGYFIRIKLINFDWHPAREPYNIPIGGK